MKGSNKNCPSLCINSCPELITDPKAKDDQLKEQTARRLNQTIDSIGLATTILNNATKVLEYTGSMRFELNKGVLYEDVMASAALLVASTITSSSKGVFDSIVFGQQVRHKDTEMLP